MGTKLILPNADFSGNSISFPTTTLKTILENALNIGVALHESTLLGEYSVLETDSNSARASIFGADISSLYEQGCSNIEIKVKTDYQIILGLGASSNAVYITDENGNNALWRWRTSKKVQGEILNDSKVFINLKRVDGANIPSTVTFDDIFDSIILR